MTETSADPRRECLNIECRDLTPPTVPVAERRAARFRFLGKQTPESALHALRSALTVVADARRLDEGVWIGWCKAWRQAALTHSLPTLSTMAMADAFRTPGTV